MEEKKNYMYGAELAISIGDGVDSIWGVLTAKIFDEMMNAVKSMRLEVHEKIIAYDVDCEYGDVTIRIVSGREELTREVAEGLKEKIGVEPRYHELEMHPPTYGK